MEGINLTEKRARNYPSKKSPAGKKDSNEKQYSKNVFLHYQVFVNLSRQFWGAGDT